jgi:SdrD B-like domain
MMFEQFVGFPVSRRHRVRGSTRRTRFASVELLESRQLLAGSLSGSVYVDANDNGVRDGSEAGIPNVVVKLIGEDDQGAAVNTSIETDNSGNYVFDDLRPGLYVIAETQPAGFADGKDTLGTLGGSKINDRFLITVLADQHGTGYTFGELTTFPPLGEDHTFRIFPGTEQRVQVRVFSRPGFDPRDINKDTVRLGDAIVREFRIGGDLNHDGRPDVLLFFKAKETGLVPGDQSVRLQGQFRDGRSFAADLNIETLVFENVRISRHHRHG